MSAAASALEAENVTVQFGGLLALDGVSLRVARGGRHGILGPNGAGKTTLFNVVSGFVPAQAGRISVNGVDVTHLQPHRRVMLGMVRTFQITNLLPELTALENVLLGSLVRLGHQRRIWHSARSDREAREQGLDKLRALHLDHLAEAPVGELGYGQQRQLEIALALSLEPELLLLDEPTAGLSAAETSSVLDLLVRLPSDLTLVIIEHDLEVVFKVADYLTVLHYGQCIADGPAEAVRRDPVVREVYLGAR